MILTDRLDLLIPAAAYLAVDIEDAAALGALLAADVPPDWPPESLDPSAYERMCAEMLASSQPGWFFHYLVWRNAPGGPRLLGFGGYTGPPARGEVGVFCSLVRSALGRGFGTEAVRGLAERALREPEVVRVRSTVADTDTRAQGALRDAGFEPAGPGAETGTVDYVRERPVS